MLYDPSQPVAVFLGPSLPRARAERVLPANYYPPVRRGDVYRLLGSGVRVIVIIDGVFHLTTPVWPREIAAALAMGIVVIGASSMGALRAAELYDLGMIGVGEVFDAYRSGRIDGDDEVALLHADEEHGYRAQSEPLINIRHNVARAVARGLLDAGTADDVLASVKASFFGERSYDALLQHRLVQALGTERIGLLRTFLQAEHEDLKERDALAALDAGHQRLAQWTEPPDETMVRGASGGRGDYALFELLERGVWRADGQLITIRAIVQQAMASKSIDAALLREATAGFYLDMWLDLHHDAVPDHVVDAIAARREAVPGGEPRRLGLTASELRAAQRRRALHAWILDQPPERFGIDFSPHQRCLRPLLERAWTPTPEVIDEAWLTEVTRRARMSALLNGWARERGIVCPTEEIAAFVQRWEASEGIVNREALVLALCLTNDEYVALWTERACYNWLLDKGPAFFGWDSFSYDRAIVREWQLSGTLAVLAESVTA